MKITEVFENESTYFYHITNEQRLYDIIDSKNLLPHEPWDYTEQEAWPDGSVEKRSYFSKSPSMFFAPEEGKPVVLRLNSNSAGFKRESTGDYYVVEPISIKYIEAKMNNNWVPLIEIK